MTETAKTFEPTIFVHTMSSGLKVVCEVSKTEKGHPIWKNVMGMIVQPMPNKQMNINLQPIDDCNLTETVAPNVQHVLFSYPANQQLIKGYNDVVNKTKAAKAGIISPSDLQKSKFQ